jgi:hypothetical protein
MKIVKQGQTFLDKVTQLTGSYENALEMAMLNNMSITDDVSVGSKSIKTMFKIGTEIKSGNITNKRVASFFNLKSEPATAIVNNNKNEGLTGIGYMAIGRSFIVS